MIQINNIRWLSEEAKEAYIELSSENIVFDCFSQPFNGIISFPLYTFDTKNIQKIHNRSFKIEKMKNGIYYIEGCVYNKEQNEVKVGDFRLSLDLSLPLDIYNDEFISFICSRIENY